VPGIGFFKVCGGFFGDRELTCHVATRVALA
jgi:hypothetical protein